MFTFFFFGFFGSSFLSYIYFLYFPDDFCMLLLLSVSTVTARVSSRRFPANGKLCTHGIIFEWPLPPTPSVQMKLKRINNDAPNTQMKDSSYLREAWLVDWQNLIG